jgi:hypothetical protein
MATRLVEELRSTLTWKVEQLELRTQTKAAEQ